MSIEAAPALWSSETVANSDTDAEGRRRAGVPLQRGDVDGLQPAALLELISEHTHIQARALRDRIVTRQDIGVLSPIPALHAVQGFSSVRVERKLKRNAGTRRPRNTKMRNLISGFDLTRL